jgi:hypothetical protein
MPVLRTQLRHALITYLRVEASRMIQEHLSAWTQAAVIEVQKRRGGANHLKPASNDYLKRWPVSKRVNSSKADADDPTLIEPAGV